MANRTSERAPREVRCAELDSYLTEVAEPLLAQVRRAALTAGSMSDINWDESIEDVPPAIERMWDFMAGLEECHNYLTRNAEECQRALAALDAGPPLAEAG